VLEASVVVPVVVVLPAWTVVPVSAELPDEFAAQAAVALQAWLVVLASAGFPAAIAAQDGFAVFGFAASVAVGWQGGPAASVVNESEE
jgi:hypothetical protein